METREHLRTRYRQYLKVDEVAARLRVSNMTVYRLIKAGELGAVRVGRSYRISDSELNKFLSERQTGGKQ